MVILASLVAFLGGCALFQRPKEIVRYVEACDLPATPEYSPYVKDIQFQTLTEPSAGRAAPPSDND